MSNEGDGAPISATDPTEVAVASADETRTSGGDAPRVNRRLEPGARLGRYEVRAVLGAGGMGVVYRAYDSELGRELAIKVVRGRHGERLLDEARTMAKLRHANVVPVFDVASSEHGVYVVMPLYEGGTLHDWLCAKPRPWRAVLDLFLAAGRGLAAAHAAGLVHRDFKPRNVFLDGGGVPLVGDFGLAAATESAEVSGTSASIAGTPAYMAPEQAAGAALDARADQYAYCISLWEGLTGVRPTDAETRTQGVLAAIPFPRTGDRAVPGWLLAAVSRGFAATPERRWPSMDALLRHLERRRGRRTRVLLGAGGVAIVGAAVAGVLWMRSSASEPCPDPIATIAPAWGDVARSELTSAFLATGLPFAQGTLDRIVPVLDRYAVDWRTRQQAYCKAARVDRSESSTLLDARMGCLDRRLAALGGLTASLRGDARGTVAKAIDAVERLPALADCDDRDTLTAYPPPASPVERARIAAIDETLAPFTRRALLPTTPTEQAEALQPSVTAARRTEWPPIVVRALLARARALDDAQSSDSSVARDLIDVAAAARDDHAVAAGWLLLLGALQRTNAFAEAETTEVAARAAIVRAGNVGMQQNTFARLRASRLVRVGKLDEAEAVALGLLARAKTPLEVIDANDVLATVVATRRDAARAVALRRTILDAAIQHYGAEHPETAIYRSALGRALLLNGDADEAKAVLTQASGRLEDVYGADHIEVGEAQRSLGNVEKALGNFAQARIHLQRAVDIAERSGDRLTLATNLGALAGIVQRLDGLDAAVPVYERALATLVATVGTAHQSYLTTEFNLAVVYINLEKCERAAPLLEHARAGFVASKLTSPALAATATLAACRLQTREFADAIAILEPVRAQCLSTPCPPGVLGQVTGGLGRALVESGQDRRRGMALAREAVTIAEREKRPADVKEFAKWVRLLSKTK